MGIFLEMSEVTWLDLHILTSAKSITIVYYTKEIQKYKISHRVWNYSSRHKLNKFASNQDGY